MNMYKHLNTGATAELIENTGLIVKMRVTETDEIKEMRVATFKRWWKPVTERSSDSQNEPHHTGLENTGKPTPIENDSPELATSVQNEKPLALSDIVKKLEDLFDTLNEIYFDGKLCRPIITVQSTPKYYGHCSTKKVWKSGTEGESEAYYEINIGAEHLNRPSENTAATMLHEMIHLFCRENDLDETCQNGRYHNKLFKQEAEKRDLKIDYNQTIGYSITAPTESFIEKLRAAGYVLEVPFARHTIEKSAPKSRRTKASKYVCPICGQTVRSTGDLNLICGVCDMAMERNG